MLLQCSLPILCTLSLGGRHPKNEAMLGVRHFVHLFLLDERERESYGQIREDNIVEGF